MALIILCHSCPASTANITVYIRYTIQHNTFCLLLLTSRASASNFKYHVPNSLFSAMLVSSRGPWSHIKESPAGCRARSWLASFRSTLALLSSSPRGQYVILTHRHHYGCLYILPGGKCPSVHKGRRSKTTKRYLLVIPTIVTARNVAPSCKALTIDVVSN